MGLVGSVAFIGPVWVLLGSMGFNDKVRVLLCKRWFHCVRTRFTIV